MTLSSYHSTSSSTDLFFDADAMSAWGHKRTSHQVHLMVCFTPKSGHCAVHLMTSSALAIKPGGIGSRLDNSEKVQPALDADTQAALTYAVRIQRNLRHRY